MILNHFLLDFSLSSFFASYFFRFSVVISLNFFHTFLYCIRSSTDLECLKFRKSFNFSFFNSLHRLSNQGAWFLVWDGIFPLIPALDKVFTISRMISSVDILRFSIFMMILCIIPLVKYWLTFLYIFMSSFFRLKVEVSSLVLYAAVPFDLTDRWGFIDNFIKKCIYVWFSPRLYT